MIDPIAKTPSSKDAKKTNKDVKTNSCKGSEVFDPRYSYFVNEYDSGLGVTTKIPKKTDRFKVNNCHDRENVILAFANAGYKIWIEKVEDIYRMERDFYVCVERED